MEGIQKGYLFCQKWCIKGEGVEPQGGASSYKTLLGTLPAFRRQVSLVKKFLLGADKPLTSASFHILGDPGADSGCEGKSKREGKYGTKKSKERRVEPLGTMSYQTSSKRSPPSWLLIGARKLLCFFRPIRSQNSGDRLELV